MEKTTMREEIQVILQKYLEKGWAEKITDEIIVAIFRCIETGKVSITDENIHNTSKLIADNFDEANLQSLYPPGSEPISSELKESMDKTADMLLG